MSNFFITENNRKYYHLKNTKHRIGGVFPGGPGWERENPKQIYLRGIHKNFNELANFFSSPIGLTMHKKKSAHLCTHITSKRIDLESPGWSSLVKF